MIQKNVNIFDTILGIDLGTSSVKVVLLDGEGNVLGRRQAMYPTASPHPGWSQQDPGDWTIALEKALPALLEETGGDANRIRGIGLCGAAHIPVLLDRDDRPTGPAILWSDCRSTREVEELNKNFGDRIPARTSNTPGCAWTLPQLLWLRKHVPETIGKAASFLTSKDYIAFLLTGEKATDPGSASATLMYDSVAGEWAEELIALTGLSMDAFPRIVKESELIGRTGSCAARFGLPPGIPVVSGCLDSVAEMIAAGRSEESDCLIRIGTAGGVLLLSRERSHTQGIYTYPFPGDRLSIKQAGTSSCGRSLEWIRDILSISAEEVESARPIVPGADGLQFFPFLHGERTPFHNPDLRGGLIGLSANHDRSCIVRAVLEGVCYSLRDCLAAMTDTDDSSPIRIIGGGTRIGVWMTILANVVHRPLLPMPQIDSSLGAAYLAAHGIGAARTALRSMDRNAARQNAILPDPNIAAIYDENFERYKRIAAMLDLLYRENLKHEPHSAVAMYS